MISVQQLSLWDLPANAQQEEAEENERHIYRLDEIFVTRTSWADGDTRPEQLDRLARTRLGDIDGFTVSNGERVFCRIIATGVVGTEVLLAHEYLCTVKEFYLDQPYMPVAQRIEAWTRQMQQGQGPVPGKADEESEVA